MISVVIASAATAAILVSPGTSTGAHLPPLASEPLDPLTFPTLVASPDTVEEGSEAGAGEKGEAPVLDDQQGMPPGLDTTLALPPDTGYVVFLDSTARMAHFTHVRRDNPQVQLFSRSTHPLFATPRIASFRRDVTIDSITHVMTFRETVSGEDIRVPVQVTLEEYVRQRRARVFRDMLAGEARKPPVFRERDDLGDMFANITKIQIPVPPNPIFSIFGKPEINLNISGAVDIKAGFRNTKSDQTQLSVLDQVRNEPDFSQEVQVNVNGTIGDKLNILADWNTQRTFEYENQLKIKYTGYDDEIVQSVEAGNVSLQTPSSFIGSSQALFGVKARMQAGPLNLTTIASQKKGQIREVAVSGGAQRTPFEIRPYNWSTNHYFVDVAYIPLYEPYYQDDNAPVVQSMQIVEEEVWITRQGSIPDPNERVAIAYIDLPPAAGDSGYSSEIRNGEPDPGQVEIGPFVRLDPRQYELAGEGYIGVLSLNINVQDNQIVAIAYRRQSGVQYGEFGRSIADTSQNLVLKMVKPRQVMSQGRSPKYRTAWNQILKNIYPIGGRNLREAGFNLDVFRESAGAELQNSIAGQPLLRVLGVDRFDASGNPLPTGDGVFDFRAGRTISIPRAEVIFPWLRPFDDGIKEYFAAAGLPPPDSSLLYPEIYDTTKTFAQQNNERNKYIIKGEATGDATSKYNLGFNVVEGSVHVLLDGAPLTPNVDYTVDYIVGEVVIRNDRALVPGANLQIKYEQNDLFQLASKTLLGARGDLALTRNTTLGFTIMNLNQQSLSDKVRLGEEPNNNTIIGIDGATTIEMPFLTRALDGLPILQTREQSQFRISGEAAYMIPDPNTRKSTIPADGGEGIAYIDDFEGARRTIPLGINYGQWTQASPPADRFTFTPGTPDSVKMWSKAKMIWFNRLPTDVRLTDVFPRKEPGGPANDIITVLDFHYFPVVRGMYNYSLDLANTLTPLKNWSGVMKPISIAGTNLVTENINFIEVWMKVVKAPPGAHMYIDMGAISEDVIPNGRLNSEDLVLSDSPNGTLQEGEDIGIDMLNDAQERVQFADLIAAYPELAADPSGDNYAFNNSTSEDDPNKYNSINGLEGNRLSPIGLIPDTEDINYNGVLDRANSYFRYSIPLDTVMNPFIVGGGNQQWYQFRIPIRDTIGVVGSPSYENIEFIRVFFANAPDTIVVRLADFSLVGNQWQELRKEDTTFVVSVVSIEDNPSYQSPPGVIRERDRTRPDERILGNEQSLALLLRGIPEGESRQAVKYYTFRPLDLFNYRTMKMFVHGDPTFSFIDENNYDAQFFFRFGLDSLNFYEYRAPIRPGWDPLNDMVIKFSELTAIKARRDSTHIISDPIPLRDGPPGSYYRVLGNPSLTQVRYLAAGVENPVNNAPARDLFGEVWINELRLTEVDDTPGWAYRFDSQLKLADVGSVSFNYSRVDPHFHGLEQRFGSRQTGTNWGVTTTMQVEKFLPSDWVGTSIPISYSRTENRVQPKYLPASDVLVSEAANQRRDRIIEQGGSEVEANAEADRIVKEAETYRVTETYAAPTFRIGFPSTAWYIRDTFNKLTYGFNYTRSRERNPAIVQRVSWSWTTRLGYSHSFSPDYFIQPFKDLFDGLWFLDEYKNMKIFFTPSSFTWSVSATRSRDVSLQRAQMAQQIVSPNFTASRQLGFGWRFSDGGLLSPSGDYNLTIESSLLGLETDRFKQQRPFSAVLGDIFFRDRVINFGEDTRYSQRNQFNTRPNIPNIFGIKKFVDLTLGYGVDYSWQNTLTRGDIGKSAGFTSNINFSSTIRLKSIFDPLFGEAAPAAAPPPRGRRGVPGEEGGPRDTVKTETPDTTSAGPGGLDKVVDQLKTLMKVFIKIPFLDYDNVNVTFTQNNVAQNSGVVGRPGFVNFWGRIPFLQEHDPRYGPSRLYQLGLISDPSGRLTNFGTRSHFPFFGWDVEPGIRAPGAVLVNTYRQTNRITFKTSRSLWEGARLDLNWNIGWAYNRTQNIQTDSTFGIPTVQNQTITGNIERSFFTMPDVLFLGVFKSNLKEVSKRYAELKSQRDTTGVTDEVKLAQAFEEGFEAFPFLRKLFGQYYPRVNWSLRWDGLEKLSLFSSFVSRLSLDHSYTSTYSRQYRNLPGPGGGERTDGQRVAYGFTPLIGLNFTFKELLKGNFGANLRYNTNTSYDLAATSRNIVETFSREISITASYSRRGFEIPFFGLALNNDIDISASYSVQKNSRVTYDVSRLDVLVQGQTLDGSTRTVLEPRIKYVLSSRVTAAVYYRYMKIEPDDAGSRIPGSTTNEAGLDIRISIQ